MKKLILLLFIGWGSLVQASSIQLGAGGITPHFSTSKKNYCNQWNNTSVIVNKSYYARFEFGKYFGITYLKGEDSICSPIDGLFLHYIFQRSDLVDVGITVGGYEYNIDNWEEHARDTPVDIDAPSTLLARINGKSVVPVLALDVGIHLIRRSKWSLKLNNLFTPIIFNHSIAYEYRF